jgi:hypothetical protein
MPSRLARRGLLGFEPGQQVVDPVVALRSQFAFVDADLGRDHHGGGGALLADDLLQHLLVFDLAQIDFQDRLDPVERQGEEPFEALGVG